MRIALLSANLNDTVEAQVEQIDNYLSEFLSVDLLCLGDGYFIRHGVRSECLVTASASGMHGQTKSSGSLPRLIAPPPRLYVKRQSHNPASRSASLILLSLSLCHARPRRRHRRAPRAAL